MRWDPTQYLRFADARSRPFLDLLARVSCAAPRRVIDLGCGPGTLTALLASRWPSAVVEGIDSSAEMIERATALETGLLSFGIGDVAQWSVPPDADVIVSNAVLQWVPEHRELLRQWCTQMPSQAWLAIQVPGNFGSPSHTLMRALASTPRWADQLGDLLRHHDSVADPAEYASLLLSQGVDVDVWETTYVHRLDGDDPVLEWVRGTGLRPVLAALSGDDGAEFEASYAEALRAAYPADQHGTLFPFRRIFAVARKP